MSQSDRTSGKSRIFRRALVGLMVVVGMATFSSSAFAFPRVIIDVGDLTGNPGQQNLVIPVYLDNFADTVAGVEIWMQLDRDDIMRFQTDSTLGADTTYWDCVTGTHPGCDSVQLFNPPPGTWDWRIIKPVWIITGSHSLTGTKMSTWEFVTTRSLGGIGADLKITGLANQAAPPYTKGIGFPQTGGTLINLLGDILPIPDTATERTVNINIIVVPLDNFSLSNQVGNSIGIYTDSILDSVFWDCTQMVGPNCVNFVQVPTPPYDSLSTRWIPVGHLDTTKVFTISGSVTVNPGSPCECGDADGDTNVTIGDAVYLIGRVFLGGPPPLCGLTPNNVTGDPDGSCDVSIGDVVYLIGYIFLNGPAPANCCATGP